MPRFLISDDNPAGYKLEDILAVIRADVITKSAKIANDERPEAQHVLANNVRVLQLLTEAIDLARDSTRTLDRAFGPAHGAPRIGEAV
ncbi:MAG: histidine kinase [Alphaproteobacteria bacterium]|nr:histidine kinase [Alphaproteobacteria bacterium]